MSSRQVIIWLEDKPKFNEEIKEILTNSDFDLILCQNLIEFKDKIDQYKQSPENIVGFVLDILIKKEDLIELGMPTVITNSGNDTGVSVLRSYLRNIDGDSPVDNSWKDCPVLILTSLNETYIKSRYSDVIKWEKSNGNHAVWISKNDDEGNKEAIKKIATWINSL